MSRVEGWSSSTSPTVVLLNFGTLPSPDRVLQLHQAHPGTRMVVLANRRPPPSATSCSRSARPPACPRRPRPATSSTRSTSPPAACTCCRARPRPGGGLDRLGARGAELLTPREAEVLELLQDGSPTRRSRDELSIGIETVRTHARNIYRKLGVASRRELARLARRDPVVVDDERRPVRDLSWPPARAAARARSGARPPAPRSWPHPCVGCCPRSRG